MPDEQDTNKPASKLFFIPNVRSDDVSEMEGPPWAANIPPRTAAGLKAGASKDDYKAWVKDPATDWCFFSGFEGLTPSLRVSDTNPPKFMHAFVGDYDGETPDPKAAIRKNSPDGLLPTAMSRTFSGGIRLLWMFEEPIPVGNEKCRKAFIAEFVKRSKAHKIIACYDEASQREIQYFEIGNDWELLSGETISTSSLYGILAKATENLDLGKDGPSIPIEKVAEEVERLFPGRWKGDFVVGSVGPLFWINDGRESIACKVRPQGMRCYSTRAPAEFVFWADIFGQRFVEKYEEERLGAALDAFWYDGKKFSIEEGGRWNLYDKNDLIGAGSILKVDFGLSPTTSTKQPVSEIEKAYRAICKTKRVDAIAPILYTPPGLIEINGKRIVNICGRAPLQPSSPGTGSPDNFPWFAEHIGIRGDHGGIWGESRCPRGAWQGDYWLAWLQRFYCGALNMEPVSGQVIFMAGPADIGKNLFSKRIMGTIAGGSVDVHKVILKDESFNREVAECGAWALNDISGELDPRLRRKFTDLIKQIAASDSITYHPKFVDAVEIPWLGRLVVTCNDDAVSLAAVPDITGTVKDKIMLFHVGRGSYKPVFLARAKNNARITKEMPYFLRWLLDEYQAPSTVMEGATERYGIASFHHPKLVKQSTMLDAITHFREGLEDFREDPAVVEKGFWEGKAYRLLEDAAGRISNKVSPNWVGIQLNRLLETGECGWLSKRKGRANQTFYRIEALLPNDE